MASGAEDEEQALQIFTMSKEILKEAGFNLRKLYSNSAALQAKINPDDGKKNPLLELLKSWKRATLVLLWEESKGYVVVNRRYLVFGGTCLPISS